MNFERILTCGLIVGPLELFSIEIALEASDFGPVLRACTTRLLPHLCTCIFLQKKNSPTAAHRWPSRHLARRRLRAVARGQTDEPTTVVQIIFSGGLCCPGSNVPVRWSSEGQLTKEEEAAGNKKAVAGEKEVVAPSPSWLSSQPLVRLDPPPLRQWWISWGAHPAALQLGRHKRCCGLLRPGLHFAAWAAGAVGCLAARAQA